MARFNAASNSAPTPTNKRTTNFAGGEAFKVSDELEIVGLLSSSFGTDKTYETGDTQISRLATAIADCKDPVFAAKAAIYARDQFHMRTITHVAAAEIVAKVKGESWTKNFVASVVQRPDDAMEIMSYYMSKYGHRGIPNALKKGLGLALSKFSEYQLAKYRGEGKAMSLVDVVNLTHPRPSEAINKLMNGTLETPDTWEVALTEAGKGAASKEEKAIAKGEAWTDLINSGKIGYFALLRNLRNIAADAPEAADLAAEILTDKGLIAKSKVLPFRYLSAITALATNETAAGRTLMEAAERAMDIAMANVPVFDGSTLVVIDVSGSMTTQPWNIGSNYRRKTTPYDAPIWLAAMFGAAILKANPKADLMLFDGKARYHEVKRYDSTSTIQAEIIGLATGGTTNFHTPFQEARAGYDRFIILSDMQGWVNYNSPINAYETYGARSGKRPYVYSFDLTGSGTTQLPANRIYSISGFSDKVFDQIEMAEKDPNVLLNKINEVELLG